MKNFIDNRTAHLAIIGILLSSFAFTIIKVQHHPFVTDLIAQLSQHSKQHQSEKVYVQLDRNFYQPGEQIWFKTYVRNANDLTDKNTSDLVYVELINPKGSVIERRKLITAKGMGSGVFAIKENRGGIYKIKAYTSWQKNSQTAFVRDVQVQKVVLPKLKMKLDFERKAYGSADEVIANLSLESIDNLPLRYANFEYIVQIEGQEILRKKETVSFEGKADIRFSLPEKLNSNDALLQVLIPHRGVTESISRSIPIVLNDIDLQFFPEGGDLVAGLKTNVAFKALNEFGKPADIEGAIYNKEGEELYSFKSFHQGMGNFNFWPDRDVSYYAKITKPAGINKKYYFPEVESRGYSLNIISQNDEQITVSVQSKHLTDLHLTAQSNDQIPFSATFAIDKSKEISIPLTDFPMGISRLTLFDKNGHARCERLAFVNPHKHLNISVKTDKEKYAPREKVVMDIEVTDENGKPVEGNFSLSVADSKLLTFADDKQGHIFSKIFLESELKGKIEEPDFYFKKDEPKAIAGLDLLMMTHGWRRFDWKTIQAPQPIAFKHKKEKALIAGKVVNECGDPIPQAKVTAIQQNVSTYTNELGEFEIKGLPMTKEGNRIKVESLTGNPVVKSFATYKNDFFIIQAEGFGNITGKIKAPRGYNFYSAFATLTNDEGQQWSSRIRTKKGEYAFHNVPVGEYTLRLQHHGYRPHQIERVRVWPESNIKISRRLKKPSDKKEIFVSRYDEEMEKMNADWLTDKNDKKVKTSKVREFPIESSVAVQAQTGMIYGGGSGGHMDLDEIVVTEFLVPLIEQDNTTQGNIVTSEEISKLPTRNISALAASTAGLSQLDEGDQISVRGSRAGGTDIYVDGIRVNALMVQSSDIEQMQVIVGGTPAEFGGGIYRPIQKEEAYGRPSKFGNDRSNNLERHRLPMSDGLGIGGGGFSNHSGGGYYSRSRSHYRKRPSKIYTLVDHLPQLKSRVCDKFTDPKARQTCADKAIMEIIETAIKNSQGSGSKYSGHALLNFYVDKKGRASYPQIHFETGGYNHHVRNNVQQAINKLNSRSWWAAKVNGRKVASWYSIPIEFGTPETFRPSEYQPSREFFAPKYTSNEVIKKRVDFRSTIYWNPNIQTNRDGKAQLTFWNSDDLTTFTTTIEGFSDAGLVGAAIHNFYTQMPFSLSAKAPTNFLVGDQIELPITLINNTDEVIEGELKITVPDCFELIKEVDTKYILQARESRSVFPGYQVSSDCTKRRITERIEVAFESTGLGDAFTQKIQIQSSGYPIHELFTGRDTSNVFELDIKKPRKGSIKLNLEVHPSVLSEVISSLERMLKQPHGCFEQTSSYNYPNALVMQYMKRNPAKFDSKIHNKAKSVLDFGYKRLMGFEVRGGGFQWWGKPPAHEALTAYGLLEFTDMKSVYPVKEAMLKRTANWLLNRRDGEGSWKHPSKGKSYWFGSNEVRDSYIVWALSEAGYSNKIKKEIDKSYQDALKTKDPYVMGLVCNALFQTNDKRALPLLNDILKLQEDNGSFIGKSTSITTSRGKNLLLETSAIVALAMMESSEIPMNELDQLAEFIARSKSKYGFGSTQATVLSLKALIEYAEHKSREVIKGELLLFVDGKQIKKGIPFSSKQRKSIKIDGLENYLSADKHKVEVRFADAKKPLPFELELSYSSALPQDQTNDCKVALKTLLVNEQVKQGETIRLSTELTNTTAEGQASPLAIVGIPCGLSAQPWQLKEIQEKGLIDYYEVIDDKVVFYFEGLEAGEIRTIHLDLKADIPGHFESPASCAYLYYENDALDWASPNQIKILTN